MDLIVIVYQSTRELQTDLLESTVLAQLFKRCYGISELLFLITTWFKISRPPVNLKPSRFVAGLLDYVYIL